MVLPCKQQILYLDELLDKENVGGSSSDESIEEVNYSHTMLVETHESESDNARSESGNKQRIGNLLLSYFLWIDINSFQSVHEVFCDTQGPQNDHKCSDR
jgi:hypothetical protein